MRQTEGIWSECDLHSATHQDASHPANIFRTHCAKLTICKSDSLPTESSWIRQPLMPHGIGLEKDYLSIFYLTGRRNSKMQFDRLPQINFVSFSITALHAALARGCDLFVTRARQSGIVYEDTSLKNPADRPFSNLTSDY